MTDQLSRPPGPPGRPGPRRPPGLAIDPRIRQRRVEVKRQEGRRRLWFLVVTAALLAATGGAIVSTRSALLDVDRVEVRGASRTARQDLLAATGVGRHTPMVDVDTPTVARRAEGLPWVLRARVHRAWPGTVAIDVEERAPAAVVAAGPVWAVVDGTGRVLEVAAARPPATPALAGVPAPGPPGSSLPAGSAGALRVVAALPPGLRSRVGEVVATPAGEAVLRLAPPGGEVRLGNPENLDLKLTAALTVIEKGNVAQLRVLDVRVPTAPVLTRR